MRLNHYHPIPEKLHEEFLRQQCPITPSPQYDWYDNSVIFLSDCIVINNIVFYLFYITNDYYSSTRKDSPKDNILSLDTYAFDNGINIITLYESDIDSIPLDKYVTTIINKARGLSSPTIPQPSQQLEFITSSDTTLIIKEGEEKVGEVFFNKSSTVVTVNQWWCLYDPSIWINQCILHISQGEPIQHKITIHPYDFLPVSMMLNYATGKNFADYNKTLGKIKAYRSMGVKIQKKTTVNSPLPTANDSTPLGHWYPKIRTSNKIIQEKEKVKNSPLLMSKIVVDNEVVEKSKNSTDYASFRCPNKHTYRASIKGQLRFGCPICSGDAIAEGVNDFLTTHPDKAALWNYEKNFPYQPTMVSKGTTMEFYWTCPQSLGVWKSSPNNIIRYDNSPFVAGKKILSGFNDAQHLHPELAELYSTKNQEELSSLSECDTTPRTWECRNCGGMWIRSINTMKNYPYCRNCTGCGKGSSRGEQELFLLVKSILGEDTDIIRNDRTILGGKEIDIYIPQLKVAIEYNGLYFHSEKVQKSNSTHYQKYQQLADKGIKLIVVWEDELRDKKDIVESLLRHKLGKSDKKKVYARKTEVLAIDGDEAYKFLEENHIQGFSSGSVYFGLFSGQELVAVSVWRRNKDTLYLDRYATNYIVVGGMGKMLKSGIEYAKKECLKTIVSFSDNAISNGDMYQHLGFELEKTIPPDYRYVVEVEGKKYRKHKFGYRIKKFRSDPHLLYQEGLTERQLARLNGLSRIYDYGKKRWVMYL